MPRHWDEIYAAQGSAQSKLKDRQTISVVDIISEGPIYGLVDGSSSVYLNDDRAVPLSESGNFYSQSAVSIALVNNSATATISAGGTAPIIESENGDKYLIVRKGLGQAYVTASNGSAGTDDYNITATLTVVDNASFFTSAMVSTPVDIDTHVPARLGIITGGGVGDGMYGEGFITKRTSNSVAEYVPGTGGAAGIWIPDGSYSLEMDRIVKIASVSGVTVTLAAVWPGTTGGYKFDVTGAVVTNNDVITQTKTSNYQGVTTQFRVGTLAQTPFSGKGGDGSTSISNTPSAGGAMEQSSNYGGSQAPKELIGTSASGFNLTASQVQEVDEARITFAYGGGHYAVSGKGNDMNTFTRYKTEIAIKKTGGSSFEAYQVLKHPAVHSGMYKNSVTFVETIDLTKFRPFADFKVRVSRISNHDGPAYKTLTETYHDWQMSAASTISNTTCVIKDILTHPFTSLAKTTFDTKTFQSIPTRSYHARGLKVSVPSNYVTREQSSDGVANYMRNTTSGLVDSTYQDWDGAFATDKAYTNNPAWVFYDILTNNRYGLGDFLQSTDIDKYALYRISRYCDGLVDDGKGGLEPRFVANLYFTKAADAYKVLKDIATVFRSMLYYIDGQVVPVMDAPSGPVYNFSQANIIEGKFSYEGTGSKTRINQCIVTWIDPDANYKASPLIVEDRLNIAETGKLISQKAVAMGATSEGQALRYGRWKLWTAANQREVVSFSTALNATFLMPGDVINIQDSARYAVRMGGRISNSGTDRSTTSIPLDSTTTLISGNTYTLSVVFVEPGAFATEVVTIDNVVYKKGDLIKQAFIDSNNNGTYTLQNIDSEVDAINAKATAAGTDALILNWTDTTRVETQPVSTSAGAVDTLTVSTAFSAIPAAESIWVLTEKTGGVDVLGSAKEYRVLAISQNSKNEFAVSAVEHYDEKFSAVDEDFTTFIADSVYPAIRHNDVVPPVLDVFGESMMNPNLIGEELTIQWTPPTNVGELAGSYEHLSGYEITHTFPGIESPVLIENPTQTSWKIDGVQDGTYDIAVRTINVLQNVSVPTIASITVSDRYRENVPRMPEGVPYTGTTSVGFGILSSSFIFKRYQYSVKAPGGESTLITNTSTSNTAWQQSCSTLPVITWSESSRNAAGEFIKQHAYIMIDASDSTDRLKLVKYHRPAFSKGYWYDMGSGNGTKYGSALTGTFSKAAGTSKVTGSGTAFLTQLQDGDVLKLDSTEGYKVAAVVSDTVLYVTNSYGSYSGVSGYIPNLRIDYANDFIIARVYNTSSGLVLAESYAKIDAVLKPAGDMIEAGGVGTEEIAENAVTVEEIDTSAATGGTFGAAVAALDAASFSSIDTDVLDANSVIAREVQVFPVGGTAPTISGTTLAGAGIDLKQDGDLYVGNAAANKYMFWDQSEGVMTFRGTLNAGDITAGTITADRIAVGSLDADKITANTITADEIAAGAITTATLAADAITADKIATNAITADAIAAGTITATEISTGAITATKVAADAITASKINVANLASINANIGAITAGTIKGNTVPDANSAPSGGETGAFLDLTAGKMVFGNSTKHILWDGTNLTISGVTIDSATLTNSSGSFVTQSDIDTSINALIDGAPGTLNTLNELADALDDDNDFHTSVTTALNARLPLSGGAMTGAITTNSTFDGRNVSVDGTKLDGIAAGATNTSAPYYTSAISVGDGGLTQKNFTTTLKNKLDGVAAGATNTSAPYYTGAIPNATASTTGLATSTQITKLDGIATGATNVTNNDQLTNGAGYITNANGGNASTFGGSLPSAYVKTDQIQALGSQANAMTISGSTITLRRGDGSTDTVTTPNTQYSVGDGGLTTNDFTNADHNKLNGIAAGATNTSAPYYTSAIAVGDGGLTQNNFTNADHTKLNGIAASANNYSFPYTVSANASNSTIVQRHSSGYIFANYFNTAPNTVSSGVTQVCVETGNDGYIRHGTAAAIRTFINVADGANNYVHPQEGVDMGAALTGANVLSDVAVNGNGHVTGFTSRALTLGNLGYTGATNANYITNNNQLTNGATYITNSGGTEAATGSTVVKRDSSADINVRLVRSNYTNQNTISGAMAFRVNNGSDNYTRFCSDGAAIRTFIGAGTSNLAIGTTATTAMAGNTTIVSGVQSLSAVGSSGISVVDGSTGTPEIGTTGNLNTLATASSIPSLSVDFLEAGTINADHIAADTIVASHIDADAITSEQLQISADSGNDRIQMDGINNVIKIFSGGVLRVKIGNLA
jgi:predicted phage tail protein